MKNVFLKCLLSGGKNEKWYHESGKHVISPLFISRTVNDSYIILS